MLLAGGTINSLGNSITPVALAFAVLELGGSATELGLVIAAYALADVVTVLFGGVLGDRMSRQLMMQGTAPGGALSPGRDRGRLIGGWATIPLLGRRRRGQRLCRRAGRPVVAGDDPADRAGRAACRRPSRCADSCQNGRRCHRLRVAGMLVAAVGSGWAIAIDAVTFAVAAVCFALIRVPARSRRDRSRCSPT